MRSLGDGAFIHRKSWEYAICVDGLSKLGAVRPRAKAIAVGAGYERPLFYFANHIEQMVATDLYDSPVHEGKPEMLTEPWRFAPFDYRRDHLKVYAMRGDALQFPDNSFDFLFCLSSIEHFGSRETIRHSFAEMLRVTRPRGKLCITTQIVLNDVPHDEYFSPREIEEIFLSRPNARLVGGDFDLRIQKSLVDYPVDLADGEHINRSPHIVLALGGVIFTSLSMFFEKR
jgi:SAM-dependent methyltransferase